MQLGRDRFAIWQDSSLSAEEKFNALEATGLDLHTILAMTLLGGAFKGGGKFTETGAGTHLRRTAVVSGTSIQINSGHGYNRVHRTGDVKSTGLSMDQVDDAIMNDVVLRQGIITNAPAQMSITVGGHRIGYDVMKLPNGRISVSTYYPLP